jgi:potassium/chloride transporter 9
MTDEDASQARRRMPTRVHSTFAARTARDDGERLNRRGSLRPVPSSEETPLLADQGNAPGDEESRETSQGQYHGIGGLRDWYSSAMHTLQFNSNRVTTNRSDGKRSSSTDAIKPRPGAFPRPVGGTEKLGTFAGVFVPTTLNVLSILMLYVVQSRGRECGRADDSPQSKVRSCACTDWCSRNDR